MKLSGQKMIGDGSPLFTTGEQSSQNLLRFAKKYQFSQMLMGKNQEIEN